MVDEQGGREKFSIVVSSQDRQKVIRGDRTVEVSLSWLLFTIIRSSLLSKTMESNEIQSR